MWRYGPREGRDPKDTDAVCTRNSQTGVAGVERSEAEDAPEIALMYI